MADTPYTPQQIARAQKLRLQRCLSAALFYAACAGIMAIATYLGRYPMQAWLVVVAAYGLTNLVFIASIASGFNLRFADPSLTAAQIVAALLLCSLTATFSGELRGLITLAYLIPLQFGAFALSTPSLMRLCLIPAITLPMAVATSVWLGIPGPRLELELLHWCALMLVLPFSAFVSGRLFEYGHYKKLSDHDELSGLLNRRAALAYLDQLTRLSAGNRVPFCVALVDFDHFKQINDTWGHARGDAVICEFARIARDTLRKGDMIARWGGEEFLAILHGDLQQSHTSIERLRAACEQAHCGGLPHPTTISIGLAEHTDEHSIPWLIERADHALYAAKSAGRNRVEVAGTCTERRHATAG
ncbi:GGDEF domain-containing protein [Niveibacterium sp. 24ML]|uniref:GGDEF domain-containing protein n=1 Tax=Niveibacterium sp. 24ML TaxID=2985512 RepID=UPI00226E9049|nr:GGDEF domain-containing protein [Niveibacterium sp. 24ML]MCX9155215.1 GGDEF domain-containing protein [Niveibacterium sp. 24ML]